MAPSDDSALESMSSSASNTHSAGSPMRGRPKITRPTSKDIHVDSDDLEQAALQMRGSKVCLLSRSVRTFLSCFDDLDIRRFEPVADYMINFISNGVNKCTSSTLRPVSILWPDTYEKLVHQMSILDAHLLNVQFKENPVNWMIKQRLTDIPLCRQCKNQMTLVYENNTVRWQCRKTEACTNYHMSIQRPTFFNNYERVALDKLLFAVYFWASCTPCEELYDRMKIEPKVLNCLWRRLQNVCRTVLEKRYPRLRLTNSVDSGSNSDETQEIDLVSIKVNGVYVVCAKHPRSNLVRLGLYIPKVSLYDFVELTESWFAHGAEVRISEEKFLNLNKKRTDLKIKLVTRIDMVYRDEQFDRNSAFGYIICQLTHCLKDYDSRTLTIESLKLILAEMEWREMYGTTAYDAFTHIVDHIAQYGETSDWYSEPSVPARCESTKAHTLASESLVGSDYVWTEDYFYCNADPIDSEGKVICRFTEPPDLSKPPEPDVRLTCHFCKLKFDCFDFSLHLIDHVEYNRQEHERREYIVKNLVECKHCFKPFTRDEITIHSALLRSHFHHIKFGCRICCVQLKDRAEYLQHMRRFHFEHETPYHCPRCPAASSFQRDIFIHFQEEHRNMLTALCPLCLRSFTVAEPKQMTIKKMSEFSKIVYNHLGEHYVSSKGFTCPNCCLCFVDRDGLRKHKIMHHNPCEIRDTRVVKLSAFIVTEQEQNYCVKALPMELFVSNKRPNLALNPDSAITLAYRQRVELMRQRREARQHLENMTRRLEEDDGSTSDSDNDSEVEVISTAAKLMNLGKQKPAASRSDSSDDDESEDDDVCDNSSDSSGKAFSKRERDTIYVRPSVSAQKFLDHGKANLVISSKKALKALSNKSNQVANGVGGDSGSSVGVNEPRGLSSEQLNYYFSRMKRADGIAPNQSVVLTPRGRPARCCECRQFITEDHFVSKIFCEKCKYVTNCPRAAISHNKELHPTSENQSEGSKTSRSQEIRLKAKEKFDDWMNKCQSAS